MKTSAKAIVSCLGFLIASVNADAQQHSGHQHEPTAEKQATASANHDNARLKALSGADILAIRRGEGWGFARPAELNGVPGPLHVLELAQELHLSDAQILAIETIRDQMREDAIDAGARFIAAEIALDNAFLRSTPGLQELSTLVEMAGQARIELRRIHLNAHIETPEILSLEQIASYNRLRGNILVASDERQTTTPGIDTQMAK
ncbi:MAG: hypothetical protein AcusKO_02200 [Acuticoccus sp.]